MRLILLFFRIAADFEKNLGPQLPQLPSLHRPAMLKLSPAVSKAGSWREEGNEEDSTLTRFARTVAHIEGERVALRNHLMVQHIVNLLYFRTFSFIYSFYFIFFNG